MAKKVSMVIEGVKMNERAYEMYEYLKSKKVDYYYSFDHSYSECSKEVAKCAKKIDASANVMSDVWNIIDSKDIFDFEKNDLEPFCNRFGIDYDTPSLNIEEFVNNIPNEDFEDFIDEWYQGYDSPYCDCDCDCDLWNAAQCLYDNYDFDDDEDDEYGIKGAKEQAINMIYEYWGPAIEEIINDWVN